METLSRRGTFALRVHGTGRPIWVYLVKKNEKPEVLVNKWPPKVVPVYADVQVEEATRYTASSEKHPLRERVELKICYLLLDCLAQIFRLASMSCSKFQHPNPCK